MSQKASRSSRYPSFEALGPLIDRLAELAERELPDPTMIEVNGWDDGDFDARASHSHGIVDVETGEKKYERVWYDSDREAFVWGEVRWFEGTGEQRRDTRVLEPYGCPVPVVE